MNGNENDTALAAAEIDRWDQTVALLEECDMQSGGEPSDTTKTVRAACERAKRGRK